MPAKHKPHHGNYRQHITKLIQAALLAADPATAVRDFLVLKDGRLRVGTEAFDLNEGRVFLIGAGKAALAMGQAAAPVLGQTLAAGILIAKESVAAKTVNDTDWPANVSLRVGAHPVPDDRGLQATHEALQIARQANKGDILLCLISGGASALLSAPTIPLAQWRALTAALLASGCTIEEFNTVRRRLDSVKGGGLARAAWPARCAALILSDVPGNNLAAIGSGPTFGGPPSVDAVMDVLERYQIKKRLDEFAMSELTAALERTSLQNAPTSIEAHNVIIGDVGRAASATADEARKIGFAPTILTTRLEGEAREVGKVIAALAKDAVPGSCLILGGESTVTLGESGMGGRNQEMALSSALSLDGTENLVVACFATDGEDGPTDAAGALVTGRTISRATKLGLEARRYLLRHDSYPFFKALDDLIVTGPTGTNVNDLVIILRYEMAG